MNKNDYTIRLEEKKDHRVYLYAYPATCFLSEVSGYPHIVGNSQFFDRMQYLWGLHATKPRNEPRFGLGYFPVCQNKNLQIVTYGSIIKLK